ncbi:uncharacterized protein FIBRA_03764 [Fibroporia radiculosa]|uniref:Uncharacterized protein n=1 Tax=Fibroporia radiculosa TaxID=599839 RepID=J4GNN5_9APHY|nr:uncharacterized protein FIBRA_03764 [Fibroporia radiculosa]CCM01700.1 predicted protein [Fibroporia radiculosa]
MPISIYTLATSKGIDSAALRTVLARPSNSQSSQRIRHSTNDDPIVIDLISDEDEKVVPQAAMGIMESGKCASNPICLDMDADDNQDDKSDVGPTHLIDFNLFPRENSLRGSPPQVVQSHLEDSGLHLSSNSGANSLHVSPKRDTHPYVVTDNVLLLGSQFVTAESLGRKSSRGAHASGSRCSLTSSVKEYSTEPTSAGKARPEAPRGTPFVESLYGDFAMLRSSDTDQGVSDEEEPELRDEYSQDRGREPVVQCGTDAHPAKTRGHLSRQIPGEGTRSRLESLRNPLPSSRLGQVDDCDSSSSDESIHPSAHGGHDKTICLWTVKQSAGHFSARSTQLRITHSQPVNTLAYRTHDQTVFSGAGRFISVLDINTYKAPDPMRVSDGAIFQIHIHPQDPRIVILEVGHWVLNAYLISN